MTDKPKTPAGLAARGRRFWRETVAEYELTDAELAILLECCRTMDDLDSLADVLAKDGPTTVGSQGQTVVHPALTEARGQRVTLHRLLASLALPDEDGETVRTATQMRGATGAQARWNARTAQKRGA